MLIIRRIRRIIRIRIIYKKMTMQKIKNKMTMQKYKKYVSKKWSKIEILDVLQYF